MTALLRLTALLGALLIGCAGASANGGGSRGCNDDGDCSFGQHCYCQGVGPDPCTAEMSSEECAEASCGGRICASSPPPSPP